MMANNEEGNDSCMYNTNFLFAPILLHWHNQKSVKQVFLLNEGGYTDGKL